MRRSANPYKRKTPNQYRTKSISKTLGPLLRSGITLVLVLLLSARARPNECEPSSCVSLGGEWLWEPADIAPANAYDSHTTDKGWNFMSVPGNWYLQGYDIPGQVWMRRYFQVPSSFQGKVVRLTFEGVDYAADVWLNDTYLGSHKGYFQPFSYDVAKLLKWEEGNANLLVIRVNGPNEDDGRLLPRRLINRSRTHYDTHSGARSEHGQGSNTGGIWAPVYLQTSEEITINAVEVQVHPVSQSNESEDCCWDWKSDLNVRLDNETGKDESVRIEAKVQPENFLPSGPSGGATSQAFTLIPGVNNIKIALVSQKTHLWWSWDHGLPRLYTLTVRVMTGSHELDLWRTNIGFRTVRLDSSSDQWLLNGKRIFLRGTNYMSTRWLSEMTAERYRFDLELMKRANINAVRVRAHVEGREFYSLCDRLGLLVWQDLLLHDDYSDERLPSFAALSQLPEMISPLYDHPSILAWALHDDSAWAGSATQNNPGKSSPRQNRVLDRKLLQAFQNLDSSRYVDTGLGSSEQQEHSPRWQDYAKPTSQSLIAEYGAPALPSLSSLRQIIDEDGIWPDDESKWAKWTYRDFDRKESLVDAGVSQGKNVGEFIAHTQGYQERLIRLAAESYRRQRFAPVSAIFQFTFVEDWPSVGWGIVDYFRVPKEGYAALAEAYQPVLPSIVWDRDTWRENSNLLLDLWIVNDLWSNFMRSTLICQLRNETSILQNIRIPVDVFADSGQKVGTLKQDQLRPGSYEVVVRVEDMHANVLGRNSFAFQVLPKSQLSVSQ